jgi:hypothetical protein
LLAASSESTSSSESQEAIMMAFAPSSQFTPAAHAGMFVKARGEPQ